MQRTGVAFWGGMSVNEFTGCVQLAERRGYESAWLIESYADIFTVLGSVAAVTSSIKLATGVTTIFTRNPTTIGIAAATLDSISNGRCVLGLGVGHKEIHAVRDNPDHNVPFEKPRQRLRETTEITQKIVYSAHHNQSVSYEGTVFSFENYEPWFTSFRDRLPIYFAALTKGTMELAGEIADGIVLVFFPMEKIAEVREHVASGAARAGRNAESVDIASFIPVCVSDDDKEAYKSLSYMLSKHIFSFAYYQNYFRGVGFGEQVDGVLNAMQDGDKHIAAEHVSREMVDAVGVGGTAKKCRERIEEYRDAGLTLPIIYPVYPGYTTYGPDTLANAGIRQAIDDLGQQ